MRPVLLPLMFLLATCCPSALAQGWAQSGGGQPLPEDQAFHAEGAYLGDTITLRITPAPGYYLYRHSLILKGTPGLLGATQLEAGEAHQDEHFGQVKVFWTATEITASTQKGQTANMLVRLAFQGCQKNGICYPPMERSFSLPANGTMVTGTPEPVSPTNNTASVRITSSNAGSTATPVAPSTQVASSNPAPFSSASPAPDLQAEDESLAGRLEHLPWPLALALFLGLGVLLGLTPCVLPMMPILSGLIVGAQARTARSATGLALAYVLASALVFAALGAAAAMAGTGLQAWLQKPAAILVGAGIMGVLGIGMLGAFELRMPTFVQTWAGQQGRGGRWGGAALMGALSSLIIGPCVAPPLAGAVLFLAKTGNVALGSAALFALSLGMGLPLILAAAGLGRWLPHQTRWTRTLPQTFGVVFLVMAGWLVVRTGHPQAWMWVAQGAGALSMLGLVMWQAQQTHKTPWLPAASLLGLAMMVTPFFWSYTATSPSAPQAVVSTFKRINSAPDFDQVLAQASQQGKTVVLDFYADWCTECLSMERKTFNRDDVQTGLGGTVALKADVTAFNADHKALMQRFGVIGPPATLFFPPESGGDEARHLRLVGFEDGESFLKRLQSAEPALGAGSHGKILTSTDTP